MTFRHWNPLYKAIRLALKKIRGHLAALTRSHLIGDHPSGLTKEQTTETMDPSSKTKRLRPYPRQWNLELVGAARLPGGWVKFVLPCTRIPTRFDWFIGTWVLVLLRTRLKTVLFKGKVTNSQSISSIKQMIFLLVPSASALTAADHVCYLTSTISAWKISNWRSWF